MHWGNVPPVAVTTGEPGIVAFAKAKKLSGNLVRRATFLLGLRLGFFRPCELHGFILELLGHYLSLVMDKNIRG
jgi:hypothetical protein